MALKQQITGVTGVTAEYHRISSAMIDYTQRKAYITVVSYLDTTKRDEEKTNAEPGAQRDILMKELNELVANPTDENEARRIELSEQVNALPGQTPEDVAPRNITEDHYDIELPQGTDFTLEFAYGWLKENVYKEAEDC